MATDLQLPFSASGDTFTLGGSDEAAFKITLTGEGGVALWGSSYGTDHWGDTGFGVYGESDVGAGVAGASTGSGYGVYGYGPGIGVYGQSTNFDAVVGETNSDAHAGVTGRNWTTGANGGVGIYGVGGLYAARFDGDVLHNGNVHCTGTHQVDGDSNIAGTLFVATDITMPASDCAEDFNISSSEDIDPGTVMVLNADGTLHASDRDYDRKVAGVLSGAGAYRPALILDKCESQHKRMPLALVGKTYCKVDASYSPIEVGDLLTTSPTPGHAMRASDPLRAFGAVIGKSLQPLKSGQGLIPILVALQ